MTLTTDTLLAHAEARKDEIKPRLRSAQTAEQSRTNELYFAWGRVAKDIAKDGQQVDDIRKLVARRAARAMQQVIKGQAALAALQEIEGFLRGPTTQGGN